MNARPGPGNEPGNLENPIVFNTADLFHGPASGKTFKQRFQFVPPVDMFFDEGTILPAVIQNEADHGLEQHRIRSRTERQMDIGPLGRFGTARIDNDEPASGIGLDLPDQLPGARFLIAHPAVPTPGHHCIGTVWIGPGDQTLPSGNAAVNPEDVGEFLGQGRIIVVRAEHPEHRHPHTDLHLPPGTAAAHVCQGPRAVTLPDGQQFFGYLADGLLPADPLVNAVNLFQRIEDAIFIVSIMGYVETLAATVAPAARIILIAAHLDDTVLLHLHLQTAVLGTENTAAFFPYFQRDRPFSYCSFPGPLQELPS